MKILIIVAMAFFALVACEDEDCGRCGELQACIDNYGEELENLINPDDGEPFDWDMDCPDGVVLTPGTAHDYYCRNMWERIQCEEEYEECGCN